MRAMDFLPAVLRFLGEARVGLARGVRLFALELLVALPAAEVECAIGKRSLNGAARFAAMRAVGEATAGRQGVDVRKSRVERRLGCLPELKLAQTGCIDDEKACRRDDKLAVRRGMTALGNGSADGIGALAIGTEQAVDKR